MRLITRPGIVFATICGVRLLIPTRAASESCPNIFQLNLISAIIWGSIEKNLPVDEAKKAIKALTKKTEEEVDALWDSTVQAFLERGYLIPAEDDKG